MTDIYQIIENNGTPKNIEDRKARTNIAPYFNVNNANAAGDLILSDSGILYKFNSAYSAGTSWNSRTSKEEVNLAEIKAPLDSPAFTGIPTAPTATAGTNDTQIATTAYADTSSSNAIIPINSNINAIESSLAIVSDGDTHIAIPSWGYVYVKNHTILTEGLYIANSAIGQNVALTTSNLTSVHGNNGGFNDFLKYVTNYVVDETISWTSKSFTLSKRGVYLILARGNATDSQYTPTIRITYSNTEAKNSGANGGNVFTYMLCSVPANTKVTISTENVGITSFFYNYNRVTIILLRCIQ